MASASHVPRARSLSQRPLRLAVAARERPLGLQLLGDARRIHTAHPRRYGAPRVQASLRAEDRSVSRGRVERLMCRHGIRALAGHRFRPCTTDSCHDLPIAPSLLRQDVSAAEPNTVWLAEPKDHGATSPACRPARTGST
ncbi:IS3 family transposase [Methylobacterium sp. P5_C11]